MNLKYKSNFARQLHQSEAIPNAQPVTYYNSERPRHTGPSAITHIQRQPLQQKTMHHIPQQSISHTPIQSIQHT